MKVDSSDIYRIYRQIETWVDLQMKLRGHIYTEYQFTYRIIPTTIFDIDDYVDRRLKLAQSIHKTAYYAQIYVCTECGFVEQYVPHENLDKILSKMLGNSFTEQIFKEDIYDKWEVLKTSYTSSNFYIS